MKVKSMTLRQKLAGATLFALAVMQVGFAAAADYSLTRPDGTRIHVFEVSGPDGRRILLSSDGTWRYLDMRSGDKPSERADQDETKMVPKAKTAEAKAKDDSGEATLTLERKTAKGGGCNYALRLVNKFPYEIGNLVLYYSAYRANGVVYDTQPAGAAFAFIKPGDQQQRELQFVGITCDDIVRIQVSGGDRCVMGELDKFSSQPGQCLARVRVVESNVVRFDK